MADGERVWLVERAYSDKGLVTLTYATPGGDRRVTLQRSANMLQSAPATAARTADPEALVPVEDADVRDRYATEVQRMRERHDPNDEV